MLILQEVGHSYGEQRVLDSISLEIAAGEIHGILGMNGAGKTTLFRCLYGQLQPQRGDCRWMGEPTSHRNIAFLETENYFYPYIKGIEYLKLLSQKTQFDIEGWNRIFQLPLDRLVDNYSTGMKKKLAFLGVLALQRPILLLDEPFNGIDIESNEKIRQILLRLQESGKTIILSSHIIPSLTDLCDNISYLSEGRLQQTYTKPQFGELERQLRLKIQQNLDAQLEGLIE